MDIQIIENACKVPKIIIKCERLDNEIKRLKLHIEKFNTQIKANKENEIRYVNLTDIFYFESVDNRTFLYAESDVMEIPQRLYELENMLSERDFIRTSKSQIINIGKIKALKPELNRTLLATLFNGEQLYISRHYVPALKKLLLIKR